MRLGAFVERHFWMVTVVVVMTCSSMTASAVAHIIEATILREGSEPIRRSTASWPALQPPQVASEVAHSGARLVQRNMFCSRCVFQLPVSSGALVATDDPPLTDLPLRLIATIITPVEAGSFVTVRNTSTAYQGAFRLGETIPGAGKVTRILATCVDFENAISRRIERVSLLTPRPATPGPRAPPARKRAGDRRSPRGTRAELLAAIDHGVRRIDADSFEIDGALIAKVLAHPVAASRGARIVPSIKLGRPNGFKLYRVRRDSIYAKIGLKNGDTIHAVNGLELRSVEKALEVYARVRNANWLSLTITRRGKLMSFDYTVRR
jgi:general secretion pathway protein C